MLSDSSGDSSSEDERLQEAFAKGLLKISGLNVETDKTSKVYANKVSEMERMTKLLKGKKEVPWIERLDLISTPAPLAPELAAQMEEQKERRKKQFQGNKKMPQIEPHLDPVLSDFERESLFYRQAQSAVMEGIPKLKELGVMVTRPDDYFGEMVKTDQHMQKVRESLTTIQAGVEMSERVKQSRQQKKKVGKK